MLDLYCNGSGYPLYSPLYCYSLLIKKFVKSYIQTKHKQIMLGLSMNHKNTGKTKLVLQNELMIGPIRINGNRARVG